MFDFLNVSMCLVFSVHCVWLQTSANGLFRFPAPTSGTVFHHTWHLHPCTVAHSLAIFRQRIKTFLRRLSPNSATVLTSRQCVQGFSQPGVKPLSRRLSALIELYFFLVTLVLDDIMKCSTHYNVLKIMTKISLVFCYNVRIYISATLADNNNKLLCLAVERTRPLSDLQLWWTAWRLSQRTDRGHWRSFVFPRDHLQ